MGRTKFEMSWDDAAAQLPQELKSEWRRLLGANPSMAIIADWCQVKAMELEWDYCDLSAALIIGVQKPYMNIHTNVEVTN